MGRAPTCGQRQLDLNDFHNKCPEASRLSYICRRYACSFVLYINYKALLNRTRSVYIDYIIELVACTLII